MAFEWSQVLGWLVGDSFAGLPGLPFLVLQHLAYALLPTLAAIAIALPVGLWVGHTGRGGTFAIQVSNAGRAIPSLGIIVLAFIAFGFGYAPVYLTLVLMAIPPIITNTYVGVREVDPDVRDSAQGLGLTGMQVLRRVEVPLALPVIMAGIRTSAVQVVATATLAAYVGLGGLGRPIFNGLAQNVQANPVARAQVLVAVVAVALLAIATELGLGRLERVLVPRALVEAGLGTRRGPAMEDSDARTAVPSLLSSSGPQTKD